MAEGKTSCHVRTESKDCQELIVNVFWLWHFCSVFEENTVCPRGCVSALCVCALHSVCVNVWWQIEGAGRLWGPMTPLAPVAAAECELHSQIRPAQPPATRKRRWHCFPKCYTHSRSSLSVWFSFPPLSFSFVFSQETPCIAWMSPAWEALLPGIKLLVCDREKEQQFAASFHTSYLITRGAKKQMYLFFLTKCTFCEKCFSAELNNLYLQVLLLVSWISNHSDNWTAVIPPLLLHHEASAD